MSLDSPFSGRFDTVPLGSDIQTPHQAVGSWWTLLINRGVLGACEIYGPDKPSERGWRSTEPRNPDQFRRFSQFKSELEAAGGGLARAIAYFSEVDEAIQGGESRIVYYSGTGLPQILVEAGELVGVEVHDFPADGSTIIKDGQATATRGSKPPSIIWPVA